MTLRKRASLAALLVLALPAAAGSDTTVVDGVRVTIDSEIPSDVAGGYRPFVVSISNDTNEPRTVDLELLASFGQATRVATRVELRPQERRGLELLAPNFEFTDGASYGWQYALYATSRGRTESLWGLSNGTMTGAFTLMHFGPERLAAGRTEVWQSEISTGPPTFVGSSTFDRMYANHAAYSALDCVVLDVSRGLPPDAALAPLLAWARLGGSLVLYGDRAVERGSEHPALAPWLDARFDLVPGGLSGFPGSRVVEFGFGRLTLVDVRGEPIEFAALRTHLKRELFEQVRFVPGAASRFLPSVAIPGIEEVPAGAYIALLLVFALVIGPINFVLVKKRGNPMLLLLTIPAISLVATLAIVSYGVFSQGLETKCSSVSLSVLDQRAQRVDVVEMRHTFVGLSRADGLRPAAGTACFPVSGRTAEADFDVLLDDGLVLGGDFYDARVDMHQLFLAERASRLGLKFERTAGGMRVTNEFSASVTNLVFRDTEGADWVCPGRLAPGESVELEVGVSRTGAREALAEFAKLFGLGEEDREPRPATWRALLDRPLFRDDCGLELVDIGGRHGVIGIVAAEDLR